MAAPTLLEPNRLVRALGKPARDFTKRDIVRYVAEHGIRMLNFRYVAGDGRLKKLNFVINGAAHLDRVLTAGVFDYVLMDCPPSLGILMTSSLAAADAVVVPMQCEYYAMEGLSVITSLISQLHDNGVNPGLTLEGILMTMFDGRTRLAADVVSEVRSHFGEKVYDTVIPRNVRISEAPSFGQPVIFYDPTSKGAEAYRTFAAEFARRTPAAVHA